MLSWASVSDASFTVAACFWVSAARAKDKTEQMQARAQAVDTLAESGVLDDGDDRSPAERELEKLRSGGAVDSELERLKSEMKK